MQRKQVGTRKHPSMSTIETMLWFTALGLLSASLMAFFLFPLQQGWNITVDLVIGPKGIRQLTSKEAKVSCSGVFLKNRIYL